MSLTDKIRKFKILVIRSICVWLIIHIFWIFFWIKKDMCGVIDMNLFLLIIYILSICISIIFVSMLYARYLTLKNIKKKINEYE